MTQVVTMALDGGGTLLVEATPDGTVERVGRGADLAQGAAETLQQALDKIKPALTAMRDSLGDLPAPPDRVQVEFGIKVTAQAGVVVARASTEAAFKVTLDWSPGR